MTFSPHPKPDPSPKKKRKRIPMYSTKREEQIRQYSEDRLAFLEENKVCPVTKGRTTQIHHKKGRIGKLYLDKDYWLAVSAEGHKWIEENPIKAKELGYSVNRL